MKPKISIVMPIFNTEKYLREALESAVNQTLKEIEIICVNDGSTDGSLAIMQEYAARDERIKIIDKPNSGYGHSMNVGVDAASGEYLGILEPDDYLELNMYERLYAIAKRENLDLIKADFYIFTGENENRKHTYHHLSYFNRDYNKVINPKENLDIFRFSKNNWSGIYDLNFIKKFNIRHNETPGASYQDNGFWFQTFCWAERVYFLNEPFYRYRFDNPNSSVNNKEKVYFISAEYDFIYEFLNKNPQLKEKFIKIFSLMKFQNFRYNLNRIAPKFHEEFIQHFSSEFKKSFERGEIDRALFSKFEWCILNEIVGDPKKYYEDNAQNRLFPKAKYAILRTLDSLKNNGFMGTLAKIKQRLGGF